MKRVLVSLSVILVLVLVGYVAIANYAYIFSKTVVGEVMKVSRVTAGSTVIGNQQPQASQMYSFAVLIKEKTTGQMYTSSSEDRKWDVIETGMCVEALFYRYPIWDLEKANTFYNARLKSVWEKCP